MSRYFFDTSINGDILPDDEGVDLPNIAIARQEAHAALYAMAVELGPDIGLLTAGMYVRDEAGKSVVRLSIRTAIDIGGV